jgi:hypothetical protein
MDPQHRRIRLAEGDMHRRQSSQASFHAMVHEEPILADHLPQWTSPLYPT